MMSVRSSAGRVREKGFTLVEALVVLAITGLVVAAVTVPVSSYWQRARLETTAGDIRNFLQQAFTEAVTQHTNITVTLQPDASGKMVLQLDPPPPPPRTANGTYTIPDLVSLALNPGPLTGGWPSSGTSPPTLKLICDTKGLTTCPEDVSGKDASECNANLTPVKEVKTLSITHVRMADGSLTPNIRYDIQVFPVWNVTVRKKLHHF